MKHIILAACEPRHGGLDSNPRYVVTHHPIGWRNSPLGIHGGAPYYWIFFLATFCCIICWVRLDSSPELQFNTYKVTNPGLGSARHSVLWAKFNKALRRWVKKSNDCASTEVPWNLLRYLEMQVKALLDWICEAQLLAKLTPWCKHGASLVIDKIKQTLFDIRIDTFHWRNLPWENK